MLAAARSARSRAIYPAQMLALNTGERDAEIRGLQWGPSGSIQCGSHGGDEQDRFPSAPVCDMILVNAGGRSFQAASTELE